MLWARPTILYMLKLRNYFVHLLSVNCDVFVQELLYTVSAKVKKNRNFFQLVRVCRLVDVNDVGEDLWKRTENVGVKLPVDFREEIAEDNEFVDIDKHFFADPFEQGVEGVLEVLLAAERELDNFFDDGLDDRVLFFHVGSIHFGVIWLFEFEFEIHRFEVFFSLHRHQCYNLLKSIIKLELYTNYQIQIFIIEMLL